KAHRAVCIQTPTLGASRPAVCIQTIDLQPRLRGEIRGCTLLPVDHLSALVLASARLPRGAAFSGPTAAWLHGLDVEPCNPIQATAPPSAGISTRADMRIRPCTPEAP